MPIVEVGMMGARAREERTVVSLRKLAFGFGVVMVVFGAAGLVEGEWSGLLFIAGGGVLVTPLVLVIVRRRRALGPIGPPQSPALVRNDVRLAARCRALGAVTMLFGLVPLAGAAGIVWLGVRGATRPSIIVFACAIALLPVMAARVYVRGGLFLRAGDFNLRRVLPVLWLNRFLWIIGGLYVAISMFDDRFDGRTSLKLIVGALAVAAFALNSWMVPIMRRVDGPYVQAPSL